MTNINQTPPPPRKKISKEWFMSMDREERDILRTLGLRERALYPELKWLADFKTGQIKHFGRRRITYQFLADLIAVPSSQGREAEIIDAKEVTRLLMRLHKAGLVGEIDNDPVKGLRFALPLSPIFKEQARKQRQIQNECEQNNEARLPNQAHDKTPENPTITGACVQPALSLSVMKRIEDHQYLFNTDSNETAAHLAAAARDSVTGSFLGAQNQLPTVPRGATSNALTIETIKLRLRASRSSFSWIDMPVSETIYQRWVNLGYSRKHFDDAVRMVEEDFTVEPTPREVDQVLRTGSLSAEIRQREAQKKKRRGGVQL